MGKKENDILKKFLNNKLKNPIEHYTKGGYGSVNFPFIFKRDAFIETQNYSIADNKEELEKKTFRIGIRNYKIYARK